MTSGGLYRLWNGLRGHQWLALLSLRPIDPLWQWGLAHDRLLPHLLLSRRLCNGNRDTPVEDARLLPLGVVFLRLGRSTVFSHVY